MDKQTPELIIKALRLDDISGTIEVSAYLHDADIISHLSYLVRFGLHMSKSIDSFGETNASPPHTPPLANNNIYINNNKNPERVFNNTSNILSIPLVAEKKESEKLSPLEAMAQSKKKGRKKPKISMPKIWVNDIEAGRMTDEKLVEIGERHGYDWHQTKELFLAFGNHHLAKDSKFVRWEKAFTTWVINDKKFHGAANLAKPVVRSFKKSQLEDILDD